MSLASTVRPGTDQQLQQRHEREVGGRRPSRAILSGLGQRPRSGPVSVLAPSTPRRAGRPPPGCGSEATHPLLALRRKAARHHRLDERHLLTDAAFAQAIAGLHVLGDPLGEGGLGDEQAVRALILLVRTARWLNEILPLDFDPLIAIDGLSRTGAVRRREAALPADQDRHAPETILVDEEIVAIIRAHQQRMRNRGPCRAQVTAIPSMPLDPSKAGSPCTVAIRVSVPSGATA